MAEEPRATRAWVWTMRQRAALAILVLGLVAALAIRAWRNPLRIDDPQGANGERSKDLATRIDPNTADASQLAALPVIGPRRAQQIVEFREARQSQQPGQRVFGKLEDLMQIKGIGKSTIEALEPYLLFEPQEMGAR